MVAEPCVALYKGCFHIGSRDRCEDLDGAASSMFQQANLEEFPTTTRAGDFGTIESEDEYECFFPEDNEVFTLTTQDTSYVGSVMESEAMWWLDQRKSENAHVEELSKEFWQKILISQTCTKAEKPEEEGSGKGQKKKKKEKGHGNGKCNMPKHVST